MSDFLDRIAKLSPKRLALLAAELQAKVDVLEGAAPEPLAVIGLGCRLPGGVNSPDTFWRLLQSGADAITEVPRDRWDVDAYYHRDPDMPGKIATRFGGFIQDVDRFDAQFFGITPREAISMDPQQRLLLEVAWEALEDAGQAPDALTGSATGVFVGLCNSDYFQGIVSGDPASLDAYIATGGAHSVAAGRLAYLLGLQGPNMAIDTACSSSLVAVHLACQSLRNRECRMALAGGVNLILAPETTVILSRAHMMAPDGRCKAFDARADGFVRSEGCGLVVLKRLSDAVANGDGVLAVIRGTAINQDGRSNGLTAPNGPAQETVIRRALENARVAPHEVAYVEAHGTGTSLGDPIEMRALGAVLGAGRPSDRPLVVGSLKTNIGHLESAAGVAGLIKVILALKHAEIPAHLHFQTPNPHIPWEQLPVTIPTTACPWPVGRQIAGVSSFGFSGTNAHVIVEAAPALPTPTPSAPARPAHVLTLSAKNEAALRALAERWSTKLANSPAPFADVCTTANTGRAQLEHRVAIVARTAEEARAALSAHAQGREVPSATVGRAARARIPEVAFLFPGQGAQYVGMGRGLYEGEGVFRAAVQRCAGALGGAWGPGLEAVVYGAEAGEWVDETAYTQVALFAVEWGLAEVWRAWGVRPSVVVGHSVGEYVAACVAGVLEVEEAVRVVAARGRLMGALPRGGAMVAVGAGEGVVREVLRGVAGVVGIAAVNGPESVVVSGAEGAVGGVVRELEGRGIRSQRLRVSHAFHSGLMEPMQEAFGAALAGVRWRAPQVTMVSTVTGAVVGAGEVEGAEYWVRQVREPVRYAAAVATMRAVAGEGLWVEVGPHPVLTGLGQEWLAGGEWVPTLRRGCDDWEQMLGAIGRLWVRGVGIDWMRGEPAGNRRTVVGLPTYPFQRERHWLEAIPRSDVAWAAGAHPLLGARVRSATSTPHFEARLAANSPAFLADHRVHGVVITPSPALMEMALAAAAQVLGDNPVLADFAIEQAMILPEDRPLVVQSVVIPGAAGAVLVEILSLEDTAWRLHARATAHRRDGSPAAAPGDLVAIRSRCRDEVTASDYYEILRKRGLDFGPSFRGIGRLWRGEREALGEMVTPEVLHGECDRYRVHPAVLDACLQVLGGAWPSSDEETYLLVGVARVAMSGLAAGRGPLWTHATMREGGGASGDVVGDVRVFDGHGDLVIALDGIHLKRARAESLVRHRVPATSDWVYEVSWQPSPVGEFSSPAPLAGAAEVARAVEPDVAAIAAGEGLGAYDELLPALEVLSFHYVLRAFAELGWAPIPGDRIAAAPLASALGVEGKYQRLLARLLDILGEEGVLRRAGSEWEVVRSLPRPQTEAVERDLAERFPAGAAEITVTLDCGRVLASVLRGETDPLQLLFSPAAFANTERLYTSSPPARAYNTMVSRAVATALDAVPPGRRVRMLEIGAGTGGTTAAVLPLLPEGSVEYVFTDVSPSFTARAAERFAAPLRSFRPLDIERDPAEQGFGGARFDIVLAANVLHATRDLGRTLAHVRRLLAPGGLLILLEGTERHRWVDLTFGLTEGWWRFSDLDLRPEHALLRAEQWLDLLMASGFAAAQRLPSAPSGRALSSQTILIAEGATSEAGVRPWLVLADRSGVGAAVGHALESRGAGPVTIGPMAMDDARLRETIESGGPWRGVVDLRSLDAPAAPAAASPSSPFDAAAIVTRVCDGVRVLVQSLVRGGSEVPPRLWLVTQGAQPVGNADPVTVTQAPVWGLGRVVALEHPELWGGLMDLDPQDTADAAAERIADQITAADDEDQVAFRAGERYVPRLIRAKAPAAAAPVRGDGVYLITGGLGGLGLKVAQWLVERGARHLVLVGRRGLPSREAWGGSPPGSDVDRQTSAVAALEAIGAHVTVVAADVGDRVAMASLFARFGREMPSLHGIVHAAAHLSGETLVEMRPEHLAAVLAPKVAGAWLLHELSRDLKLDFYVLFSSTTTLLGSARLGHYAAGNQFLDALAHHRRAEGRPALSVNWGTWDEMRAASEADRRRFLQAGLLPMRAGDALDLLGRLLSGVAPQATVAAVDWTALTAVYEARRRRPFLEGLATRPDAGAPAVRRRPAELLARLAAASAEARRELLVVQIREEVGQVLRLDVTQIDVERGLFDMGMDSLMALDLKTRLETLADQRLPSTLTFNYPTVTAMAGYLVDRVFGLEPAAAAAGPGTEEGNRSAPSARDGLTEDEIVALLAEKLERMR